MVEVLCSQNRSNAHPVPIPGFVYDPQSANFYVKTEFTTINNYAGAAALTAIKDYDYDKNGNVTAMREYGFVAAGTIPRSSGGYVTGIPSGITPVRITATGFHAATPIATNSGTADSDAYYTYNISTTQPMLHAVQWSEVQNGSATPKSRNEIYYDGATSFSTAPPNGNPTKQLAWDSYKGGTTRAYSDPLTTTNGNAVIAAYNSFGMPTSITDANGVETQITYGSITGPSGSYSDLYPTQTVTAYGTGVAKTSTAAYDFYTGAVTTATDMDNGVSTVMTYDVLARSTLIKAAYNTQAETRTAITYDDEERRVITRSDLNVAGDGKIVKVQHFDRLGRVRLTRVLENPAAESATEERDGIKVQTRYGIETGYTYQISSNPYRANTSTAANSEPTMGWTRGISFTNGRSSETETFAGASFSAVSSYHTGSTGLVATIRDTNKTYVRDQADKWRMSETNGLGQLVKVTEDPTSSFTGYTHTGTNVLTEYTYDTLSNLTGVSMGYGSGQFQTRSFSYSSLSRLLSASNPESGAITYQYDPNGNLTHKADARSITTDYTYDVLNRPTLRNYSDSTPDVTYTYDGTGVAYGKGRLATVSSTVSTTAYTAYDPTGGVLSSTQSTDGLATCSGGSAVCLMSYKYNLAGEMTEETYPSGRIVHHNYATDGKLTAVSSRLASNKPAKSYAQNFSYNAAGAVTDMQLGNMRWEHTAFNTRLQPTKIALGTTVGADDMLNLGYGYGTTANNGNVLSQTISVADVGINHGFVATQTYTYDDLDRLKSATEMSTPNGGGSAAQSWKQTYLFDRFGNRNFDTTSGATTTMVGTCTTAICNPSFDPSNNRFAGGQGYLYDATGSVTQDAEGKKFVYDAENKQVSFGGGGSTTNGGAYAYDGDGHRVKKEVAGEVTIFVYDDAGQMVAEYTTTTSSSPQINYLTADMLGSPRIDSDASGAVVARHDYLPYGEELFTTGSRVAIIGYSGDGIRQKFTSKERDAESGHDYFLARYYSVSHGRFSSVDPIAISYKRMSNPQGWNLYVYAGNNPLAYIDPTGMERVQLGQHTDQEVDRRQREIDQELADESTSDERRQELYRESATLETEREGNRVARAFLARLQSIGEGQGLQVSDFTLSTDSAHDFPEIASALNGDDPGAGAGMFTLFGYSSQIYINTNSIDYRSATGRWVMLDSYPHPGENDDIPVADVITYMGTSAVHERSHLDSPTRALRNSEGRAYTEQRRVLEKFGPDAFMNKDAYRSFMDHVVTGSKLP